MNCLICDSELIYSGRGRPRMFCEECIKFVPNTVFNPKYYTWWKFIISLSKDEIQALVSKYKNDSKYLSGDELRECRTRLKLLFVTYNLFLYR